MHYRHYVPYKGLLKEERDEYGVKTEYQYDCFGRPKIKTISAGTEETLVFNVERTATTVKDTGLTSQCLTTFDELFGNTEKTEYQGKDETDNALTTTYGYDDFNERLISVKNDADENPGENTLTYNEKGKLQKVTAAGYNGASGAYGYAFEYDQFGNVSKSSLAKETGEEQVLSERVTDYALGKTTEKKYRETGNADETVITLDKYGRTDEIREKDFAGSEKTTTFTRQNLSESAGAAEVTEMYDPYENRTYVYSYDDANNCTGYTIKDGNNAGEEFFSIKKTGENKVSYKLSGTSAFETDMQYDDSKLLNPRLSKTTHTNNDDMMVVVQNTEYTYDLLGRITRKQNWGANNNNTVSVTELSEYKSGTTLRSKIDTNISDSSINNQTGRLVGYGCVYEYAARGLIEKYTETERRLLETEAEAAQHVGDVHTEEVQYIYDKADRLKSEIRPINGISTQTEYYYRPDGGLEREQRGTNAGRTYTYDHGRLKSYQNQNESDKVTFTYDNFGNCTGYGGAGINVTMAWKRGNLLANYVREETGNNVDATYVYNSRGQRCKKSVNEAETTYYYDGGKLIAEDRAGRKIRYQYDAEGISGFVDESTGLAYYYLKDGSGNTAEFGKCT